MGYPNPAESEYDLFMTGHAGASVSTTLGLSSGDDFCDPKKAPGGGRDRRRGVSLGRGVRSPEQRPSTERTACW